MIGLKTNHIIILENKEEYVILNEIMYDGKKYFLAMGIKDKEVVSNDIAILEEYISGFDTYVSKVTDKELIGTLSSKFKEQL